MSTQDAVAIDEEFLGKHITEMTDIRASGKLTAISDIETCNNAILIAEAYQEMVRFGVVALTSGTDESPPPR